jgi:hypothetical protein
VQVGDDLIVEGQVARATIALPLEATPIANGVFENPPKDTKYL